MPNNSENTEFLLSELETLRKKLADSESDREALLIAVKRYEVINNIAFDGFGVVDFEGRFVKANEALARLLGYSVNELIGRGLKELYPDYNPLVVGHRINEAMKTGSHHFEAALRRKDGNLVDFDVSASFSELDQKPLFYLFFRDISEQKRAEKALRENEEKYRTLVEMFPHAITIFQDNRPVFVNDATAKMLGYTREELLEMDVLNPVPERERQKLFDFMIRRLQGIPPDEVPLKAYLLKSDGTEFPVEVISTPITLNGRRALQNVTIDITDRIEAQDKLTSSEGRYKDLFENLMSGYILGEIIRDSEGSPIDFIFLEVNKTFEKMYNRRREDVIGKRISEIIPQIKKYNYVEICGRVALTGKSIRVEVKSVVIDRIIEASVFSAKQGQFAVIFTDITERKRANEELQKSQEAYREMVENINDVIYAADQNGILTYISPIMQKVLGYTPSELVGSTYEGLIYEEDLPEIRESYKDVLEGKLYPSEYRVIAKSGEVRWVRTSSRPVIENDKVIGIRGVLVDITERKRAEDALRESEERYRAIWENSPVGICLTDREGIYHYVNKTYCEIYGYTKEELIGHSFQEMILPAGHPKAAKQEYSRLFDSPENARIEETELFIRKDGRSVYIEYTSDFVMQNGVPKYLVAMNIDITEKKKAIDALRRSEEGYRLLFENAGEVIANIDRDGKFLMVNRAAASFFKITPEEFDGKFLWDIFPVEGVKMYKQGILPVMKTGKAIMTEAQYTIIGELKWFRTNIQPIRDSSGKVTSTMILSTDISQQKKLDLKNQARLKLLQKLRLAKDVDECLMFGCQAIYDAQQYRRAVLTLHSKDRVIINLGQVGMSDEVIAAAKAAPAPDPKIAARVTHPTNRIGHSFFVPLESGITEELGPRRIPQSIGAIPFEDAWKNGDELFSPILSKENKYEGWLSVDTPFDGKRPNLETVTYLEEIVDITAKQVHELQSMEKLRLESQALFEKNITLRQVLDHIEDDKMEFRQKIGSTVYQVLIPALEKLINNDGKINQTYLNILKAGLPQLATPSGAIIHQYSRLSPREREICNMIKNGATSKEIASALNISLATVRKHRELIRKKLEISNKDINLATYLEGT